MVRTSENKLIIKMDVNAPADDLQALQRDIIGAIQCYDYKNFGNFNGCPFGLLLELLQTTLPTYHQQRAIMEFTEMAHDPAISDTAILEWHKSHREWLLKELNEIENQ